MVMRKNKSLLHGPVRITTDKGTPLDYSVHTCPALLFRDLVNIFPEQAQILLDSKNDEHKQFFIIPTFQPTMCDMTDYSEETENRKNNLLDIVCHL
jgi:hypothetical protein